MQPKEGLEPSERGQACPKLQSRLFCNIRGFSARGSAKYTCRSCLTKMKMISVFQLRMYSVILKRQLLCGRSSIHRKRIHKELFTLERFARRDPALRLRFGLVDAVSLHYFSNAFSNISRTCIFDQPAFCEDVRKSSFQGIHAFRKRPRARYYANKPLHRVPERLERDTGASSATEPKLFLHISQISTFLKISQVPSAPQARKTKQNKTNTTSLFPFRFFFFFFFFMSTME